ncbi:VacJ family lipoprotein [Belnapia sp. F-4-1]|uniref:MlaA family lipoprotein n=1 Tax=Belnapia sp. F-4-1 TaxID=1545443 RepID=UPI00068A7443|nr:VacJ family lipoprotein [Belnapia sp. F-4-1]
MRRIAPFLVLLFAACAQQGDGRQVVASSGRTATDATGTAPPVTVTAPTDPTDPYEATNRRVLDFNFAVDDAAIRPAAVFYRNSVGNWTRTRIRNVLNNLNEPAVAANSLLQGRPLESAQTVLRFVFNSTAGLGGMFDLAQIGGPPRLERDFGQTLHTWGLPDGPYLMVPVLGPSNPRELTGSVVNGFMNPLSYVIPFGANIGRGAVGGLDTREQNIETLDEIRNGSLDSYARLRSLWQQHRNAELGRTSASSIEVLDDPGAN